MKKFTSLLISCSLVLAGAALAQQPEEQATPKGKPAAAEKGKGRPATVKPEARSESRASQAQPRENAQKPANETAVKRRGAENAPAAARESKAEATPKAAGRGNARTKADRTAATPEATAAAREGRKGMKNAPAAAKESATPAARARATAAASATPAATASVAPAATATATPATAASATPAASASVAGATAPQANAVAKAKKPDPQQVQKIRTEHANFRAQARPDKVPAVTFNASHRIQGADRWQGRQYEAFRSYRPERHDERWYHSHYNRVELVGGGYYYWNNGYWYPAWGYNPSSEYYAYDGPIYVGHRAEPPDRVIADVQAALQTMGYYRGEVDGLLGPLTREALTAYQSQQGLTATAVIDEPTLDALGMG